MMLCTQIRILRFTFRLKHKTQPNQQSASVWSRRKEGILSEEEDGKEGEAVFEESISPFSTFDIRIFM